MGNGWIDKKNGKHTHVLMYVFYFPQSVYIFILLLII